MANLDSRGASSNFLETILPSRWLVFIYFIVYYFKVIIILHFGIYFNNVVISWLNSFGSLLMKSSQLSKNISPFYFFTNILLIVLPSYWNFVVSLNLYLKTTLSLIPQRSIKKKYSKTLLSIMQVQTFMVKLVSPVPDFP